MRFEHGQFGHFVLEKQINRKTLVGEAGNISGVDGRIGRPGGRIEGGLVVAVEKYRKIVSFNIFHALHQGEGKPGFESGYDFARELGVDTDGIAHGVVFAGIDNAYVIDRIGD